MTAAATKPADRSTVRQVPGARVYWLKPTRSRHCGTITYVCRTRVTDHTDRKPVIWDVGCVYVRECDGLLRAEFRGTGSWFDDKDCATLDEAVALVEASLRPAPEPIKPVETPRRDQLSDDQWDALAADSEAGATSSALQARYGLTEDAVSYNQLRLGAFGPRHGIAPRRQGTIVCSNRVVRPFTEAEDAVVLRMDGEGASYAEIGRALGRSGPTIRVRSLTLAKHDALREAARAEGRAA